jgi:hypothetical protein
MLLNKIPVLDKGFVAELDCSMPVVKLNDIAVEYFKKLDGKFLADMSSLTLLVKCPLFVQLNLSLFNLKVTSLPSSELEVYLPNAGEVGSTTLQLNNAIAADMQRTSEALLLNSKAYQADGCDRFISQILTPINTYTTIVVYGMYNDWCRFVAQNNAPTCIASYMDAVSQILKAEWR